MSLKFSIVFSLFLLFHNAYAFNITQVLSQYPNFNTFNSYLTQTNLTAEINSRQTITVLVVDNGNLASVFGKSLDVLKKILSVHVILDYFDVSKLQTLSTRSTIVTTLFQTSGVAEGQQGFLNITRLSMENVAFGSMVPGSVLGSNLVRSIASQPYDLSVLQVSNVIVPVGIDGSTDSTPNSATSPSQSRAPSSSPKASPHAPKVSPHAPSIPPKIAPRVSPATSPSRPKIAPRVSPATSPSKPKIAPHVSPATSPSKAPSTSRAVPIPSKVPSPSKAPSKSPAAAPTLNAPAVGVPAADAPAPGTPDAPAEDSPSAATTFHIGFAVVFTTVSSTLCLASRI